MSQQTLQNNVPFGNNRTAINSNFTELYADKHNHSNKNILDNINEAPPTQASVTTAQTTAQNAQTTADGKADASHSHGASDLSGIVKTVNNNAPDAQGNVNVTGGGTGGGDATETAMGVSFVASNPQNIMQGVTVNDTDSVASVLRRMLRQATPPTYLAPTLTLSGTASGNVEIGSNIAPVLTPTFTQRNGGTATERRILRGGTVIDTSSTVTPFTDTEFQLLAVTNYTASVDYGQGGILNDSLGEPDETGRIPSGTVTSGTVSYNPVRRAFFGALGLSPSVLNDSAQIRALPSNFLNPVNGTVMAVDVTSANQGICFAYPATLRDPTSIIMQSTGFDMKGSFNITRVQVEGANGAVSVEYKVLTMINAAAFTNDRYTLTV